MPAKKVGGNEAVPPQDFNKTKPRPVKEIAGHPHEEAFQVETAAYLDAAMPDSAWWCHIPNQGMFASTRQILAAGARFKKQGLKAGAPDNLIVWAGRSHFIELKSKTGRLSDAQKIVIPEIESAGAPVAVARTLEDVAAALTAWGIPLTLTPDEFRSRKSIALTPTRMSVSEFRAVMGLDAAAKSKKAGSWQKKLTAALRSRAARRKPDPDSEQAKTIPQSNLVRDV